MDKVQKYNSFNITVMLTKFGIFTTVKIQVQVFWVVTSCNDVVGHQHFGRPCCLHLQFILPQHYTTTQSSRPPLHITKTRKPFRTLHFQHLGHNSSSNKYFGAGQVSNLRLIFRLVFVVTVMEAAVRREPRGWNATAQRNE
jgi:hypothetical protein